MITENLINDIKEQFHINWTGIHGHGHWARVYDIGMKLTDHTGANRTIVQLFSVFHDSGRHSEGSDPQHGLRGANIATQFRENHLRSLSDDEFDMLHTACRLHTSASSHENITSKTRSAAFASLMLSTMSTVRHCARFRGAPAIMRARDERCVLGEGSHVL